jgi:hypothetical protein
MAARGVGFGVTDEARKNGAFGISRPRYSSDELKNTTLFIDSRNQLKTGWPLSALPIVAI